ncbi:MAG: hypothetical protein HY078_14690 [Elusimicrobia bacterium]|nr:hypothetical protein [Elusimicrobiota bacterium]
MKDKITLLIKETGCTRGEAELALGMCGYDVERAVGAIPRLFQNVVVLKGKARVDTETLYVLFLAILDLKNRALVRVRAVASYNPAALAVESSLDWYGVEKHLYACRLRDGAVQPLSQEIEQVLTDFFSSAAGKPFYSEAHGQIRGKGIQALRELLFRRFSPHRVDLSITKDVLDMGQFQEIGGAAPKGQRGARGGAPDRLWAAAAVPGSLVLKVALDGDPQGTPAGELRAGDLVYAYITDTRDVAQYLARLFGAHFGDGGLLLVPVEAVESEGPASALYIRVRFSLGVCGDVDLPPGIRLRSIRKAEARSWWKKLFGA